MQRAFDQFKENMKYVKELDTLYIYLKHTLLLPNDLTDILRAEWVYTVSAMDKLIHEIVRIGMIEAFQGTRVKTRKFLTFTVSVDTHTKITGALLTPIPPPEFWFEQEIIQKHKTLSFQEPDKISEGLSLIWEEEHKWQKLSVPMGISKEDLRTKLKTIVSRRNQIVHEADLDLITGIRSTIDKPDIDSVVYFIEKLSEEIFIAVK